MMDKPKKKPPRADRYYAVAQWIQKMPDKHRTGTEQAGSGVNTTHNNTSLVKPENWKEESPSTADKIHAEHAEQSMLDNFSNITINLEHLSRNDDNVLNGIKCEVSSTNLCSNDTTVSNGQNLEMLDVNREVRRVHFDVNCRDENSVTPEDLTRSCKDDSERLRQNMVRFLVESASRRSDSKHPKYCKRAKVYMVDFSDAPGADTEFHKTVIADPRIDFKKKSSSFYPKDDITPSTSAGTVPRNRCMKGARFGPSWCAATRKKRASIGQTQAPLIRGLVGDTVDNQKPSIVRASKNANIREEFALKQKVQGYRAFCTQNIIRINHEQQKLSSNLLNLKRKIAASAAARAQMEGSALAEKERARTEADDLFLHSKGYVPNISPECGIYGFPPLTYPKRRVLTVHQT